MKIHFSKVLRLLFILGLPLTLFAANRSVFISTPHYQPRLELGLKTGNQRDITRLGPLIPLYEPSDSSLLYTHFFLGENPNGN